MSDSTLLPFLCRCDLQLRNFCFALHVGMLVIKEILLQLRFTKTAFLPETYLTGGGTEVHTELTMLRFTGTT